jgi:hypothetical protein
MSDLQFKLHNGKAVTISKEYYDDLVSIGLADHTRWKTNKRVVVVRHNGRNIPLARLITYTIPRWKIKYYDNNPLNLTHGNLITQYDGRSKHDYRKLVTGSNPLSD